MNDFDNTLKSSSKDSLPPRIYIVGDLKQNPMALVKVADIEYVFSCPLDGFDSLFKIHLALGTLFPRQSLTSWAFIDKFIYKSGVIQINNSQLTTIINEMNIYRGKNTQQHNVFEM